MAHIQYLTQIHLDPGVVRRLPEECARVGITRPLVTMQQTVLRIADTLDFTQRVPRASRDEIGDTVAALVSHVEELEKKLNGHFSNSPVLHMSDHGVWHGEDFAI